MGLSFQLVHICDGVYRFGWDGLCFEKRNTCMHEVSFKFIDFITIITGFILPDRLMLTNHCIVFNDTRLKTILERSSYCGHFCTSLWPHNVFFFWWWKLKDVCTVRFRVMSRRFKGWLKTLTKKNRKHFSTSYVSLCGTTKRAQIFLGKVFRETMYWSVLKL